MTKQIQPVDKQTLDLALGLIISNKLSIRAASKIYKIPFSMLRKEKIALASSLKDEYMQDEAEDETNECEGKNEVCFKTRLRKNKRTLNSFKNQKLNKNYRKKMRKIVTKRKYIRDKNIQELIKVSSINKLALNDLLNKPNTSIDEFINQSFSTILQNSNQPITTNNTAIHSFERSLISNISSPTNKTPISSNSRTEKYNTIISTNKDNNVKELKQNDIVCASFSVNETKKITNSSTESSTSSIVITESVEQASNSGLDSLKNYLVELKSGDLNKTSKSKPNNIFKCLSCHSLFADLRKLHHHQDFFCRKPSLSNFQTNEIISSCESLPHFKCNFCKIIFHNRLTFMSHILMCSAKNSF